MVLPDTHTKFLKTFNVFGTLKPEKGIFPAGSKTIARVAVPNNINRRASYHISPSSRGSKGVFYTDRIAAAPHRSVKQARLCGAPPPVPVCRQPVAREVFISTLCLL